jgi:hypothetical protein
MSKKLDLAVRVLAIVLGLAAVAFAFLLKGKVEAAMTATNFAVADTEIGAAKEFDPRMATLSAKAVAALAEKRKSIADLELTKKDLLADVADKKTKIEGLTAANTTLEGERAELTRKRDELAAQLTDANSKKDSAVAELTTVKEDLVRATEKANSLYTKEQLAEVEDRATKAEEASTAVRGKYVALHNWAARAADTATPGGFQRDPLAEPSKDGAAPAGNPTNVAVAVEAASDNIVTTIVALDARSGIIAFSVGQESGIQEKASFQIKVGGKEIGRVLISSVKGSLSYGQLQPGKELDLSAVAKASSVTLSPSNKLAAN